MTYNERASFSLYGGKAKLFGGDFCFPTEKTKKLRSFHFILPKLHFILPKFYSAPPWGIVVSHRAIQKIPRERAESSEM